MPLLSGLGQLHEFRNTSKPTVMIFSQRDIQITRIISQIELEPVQFVEAVGIKLWLPAADGMHAITERMHYFY